MTPYRLASRYELCTEAYPSHLNRRVQNPATLVPNIRRLYPARTALHVTATCTAVPQTVLHFTALAAGCAGKRMWWTVCSWRQSTFPAVLGVDLPTYYGTMWVRRKKTWMWVDLVTTEPRYRSRTVTGLQSGEPKNRGSIPGDSMRSLASPKHLSQL
jgi:hypothetical protein